MTLSALQISTTLAGGAGIAAGRLHRALEQAGVESRVTTGARVPVPTFKARFDARRLLIERRIALKSASRRLAYFSDDRVAGPDRLADRPPADVLNLHWVAHLLDYGRFFATVPQGQPLVWTLHDMAPMTGGCHYDMGCGRFTDECGACPLLGSTSSVDLTRRIHRRKRNALAGLQAETTRIVAPSRWLAGEARRSSLLGRFDVEVIPNGLDVETFRVRDKGVSRKVLGLPADGKVVLFAADRVNDYRKGFDLLQEAIGGLRGERKVTLASIGAGGGPVGDGVVRLGSIGNERVLSHVYSAADLFVLPTRADNLPNVLVEAMACAVPCVSFDVGGVPDVVRHGNTGLLAPAENVEGLRAAILRLLDDDGLRYRLGEQGRAVAEAEFSDRIVAERYTALYEELIAARSRRRAAAE